ncbi:hypothetical protein AAGG74_17560 [Bacillus mexicanus]|uniref:hypothetical protein n=1 Tax=Bacillus mexicanus TaxID=2834415 RepID=UPI003D259BE6
MFVRILTVCLVVLGCLFTSGLQSAEAVKYSNGQTAKAGDVLISKKSLDNYLVGHAAIVGGDGSTAIEVYKGRSTVKSSKLGDWFKKQDRGYNVMRYKNSGIASGAGAWASYNVGAKYNYKIVSTSALRDWKDLYCSKFVYQAFYFSGGVKLKMIGDQGEMWEYPPTSSWVINPNLMTVMENFTRVK